MPGMTFSSSADIENSKGINCQHLALLEEQLLKPGKAQPFTFFKGLHRGTMNLHIRTRSPGGSTQLGLFLVFQKKILKCRYHGCEFLIGRHHMQFVPIIDNRFSSSFAKSTENLVALIKIRKILFDGIYAKRTEKHHHLIVADVYTRKIFGHGTVNGGANVCYLVVVQYQGNVVLIVLSADENVFFIFVLFNQVNQFVDLGFGKKDLALSVVDVFLQIQGNCF